jgi:hypothetical protein
LLTGVTMVVHNTTISAAPGSNRDFDFSHQGLEQHRLLASAKFDIAVRGEILGPPRAQKP